MEPESKALPNWLLRCFKWWKAFFNLMGFICILLVYFWGKIYHLYIILLADLSLLFLPHLLRWVQDLIFSQLVAHFSSSLRAIYSSWQYICLSWPTYEYSAFSDSPYFLFNIIRLVFSDLFQLFSCPMAPHLRCLIGRNPADGSDSISLLTWPVTLLSLSHWPLLVV